MVANDFLSRPDRHGLGSHRTGSENRPRLSVGSPGREGVPDVLMETSDVAEQFGISLQRVHVIARTREWRFCRAANAILWYRADVQEEAARRIERGLKG